MKTKLLLLALLVSSLSFAQYTAIPDANFENALSAYDDIAHDGQVPTANINTITDLDVYHQNITDLTGIEDFTALTTLDCSDNQLSNLDVSQNTNLTRIDCIFNQLSSLNVKNGNNTNFTYFAANNNPNLLCIEVDDVAYCTAHWTHIDMQSSFSTNCRYDETYVPDDNFEHYLETHDTSGNTVAVGAPNSMGNGVANDDYVTTALINTATNLDVSNQSIANLTGIEDFTALTNLLCYSNQLSSLDVSQNTNLTALDCSDNQLSSLNVKNGNNTNITYFKASNNPNLLCIEVDNVTYSTAHWTNIDTQSSFSTNCHFGETYVPDDNFENFLETHDANGYVGVGDPNSMGNGILNDNYVTTAKINTITSLIIYSKNIYDLTGIEDFTALTTLFCYSNHLSDLDVSQNTNLTVLSCGSNQLSSLDVSQNINLTELYCDTNQISSLDVSQNTNLTKLFCSNNQLSSLDVSHNTDLTLLTCGSNQLSSLDVSHNTDLTYLYCSFNQLNSLDISHVASLEMLRCAHNQLTDLNLSQDIGLRRLKCFDNQLTSLNVKNGYNTNITIFDATDNPDLSCIEVDDDAYSTVYWTHIDAQSSFSTNCHYDETYVPDDNFENYLETHDAGGNTVAVGDPNSMGNGVANDDYVITDNINTVTDLDVGYKNITNLTGIEAFASLTNLNCYGNQLTNLDISQNTNLTKLDCSWNNQLSSLDISQNTNLTELGCFADQLSSLNVSQNANLTILSCGANQISSLNVSQNSNLDWLGCSNNQLSNLDVSQNSNLTHLYCTYNQLSSLDVSQNTNLNELFCSANQLTDLNVSQNTNLTDLSCNENQLTSLDVSQNTELTYLFCSYNQLTSLNIKNNHNTNITSFDATNNPNLTCIEVDDPVYSTTHWTHIDPQTRFSTNCSIDVTYIPDDNFENYLETHDANGNAVSIGDPNSMGNGIANDDYVTTTNINSVTNLDVRSQNINDFTGIEDFTALRYLNCNNNQLTSLDFNQNTNLTLLECSNNQLTGLNLTQNANLTQLNCSYNQLTNLNIANGNNTNFTDFNATNNPNLLCIEVDDATYSLANWPNIDPQSSFSTDCAAGVDESALNEAVTMYPNPVNHILNLSAQDLIENISIYNVTGQEVINTQANTADVQVNMGKLQKGIYFVKAQIKGRVSTFKVVKE